MVCNEEKLLSELF